MARVSLRAMNAYFSHRHVFYKVLSSHEKPNYFLNKVLHIVSVNCIQSFCKGIAIIYKMLMNKLYIVWFRVGFKNVINISLFILLFVSKILKSGRHLEHAFCN